MLVEAMKETMLPAPSMALSPRAVPAGRAGESASPEEVADAELMTRTARGDRGAFGVLVERHQDALVSYLAHLTGAPDRAEDLAQEAFLRLYAAAGKSYRERGQLTAFLYRIATNLLRSEQRRANRWRRIAAGFLGRPADGEAAPALPAAVLRAAEPRPSETLLRKERQHCLAMAVAALPFHLRVPLVLAEIEDWPQQEIANLLGCRVGTIKSRLFRARQRLREGLAPYFAPPEMSEKSSQTRRDVP